MKFPTILGLGGVPPSCTLPTTYEGCGILSAAMAMPDVEYQRRHRVLVEYLEKRWVHVMPESSTIH
jgi:hypothetical protein